MSKYVNYYDIKSELQQDYLDLKQDEIAYTKMDAGEKLNYKRSEIENDYINSNHNYNNITYSSLKQNIETELKSLLSREFITPHKKLLAKPEYIEYLVTHPSKISYE